MPVDVLVPVVAKHLVLKSMSDRAIRALSSLLTLGNVVGDNLFANAIYVHWGKKFEENALALLDSSGSESWTLAGMTKRIASPSFASGQGGRQN